MHWNTYKYHSTVTRKTIMKFLLYNVHVCYTVYRSSQESCALTVLYLQAPDICAFVHVILTLVHASTTYRLNHCRWDYIDYIVSIHSEMWPGIGIKKQFVSVREPSTASKPVELFTVCVATETPNSLTFGPSLLPLNGLRMPNYVMIVEQFVISYII